MSLSAVHHPQSLVPLHLIHWVKVLLAQIQLLQLLPRVSMKLGKRIHKKLVKSMFYLPLQHLLLPMRKK